MKNKTAFIEGFNVGFHNKTTSLNEYWDIIQPQIDKAIALGVMTTDELNAMVESKKEGFRVGQESDETCKDPIKHFECWESWKCYELPKDI